MILLIIEGLVWFVAVPMVISMSAFNVLLYVHTPTIQEYIIWQVLGFLTTLAAVHVTMAVTKKRR